MGEAVSKDTSNKFVVVALQDFKGTTEKCLSFQKNDEMTVLDDESNPTLWYAENHRTKMRGLIPSNIVVKVPAITSEPWYFGKINRAKTANLLKRPGNACGAFLIREVESTPGEYGLSLLGSMSVIHYKIYRTSKNEYYLNRSVASRSLQELVQHHSIIRDGLDVELGQPCVDGRPSKISGLDQDVWEIPREDLALLKVIGRGHFGQVYMGFWKSHQYVAIKTLKNDGTITEAHLKSFLSEAQIMKGLIHKHLVRLYGMCTQGQPIYIVTELMKNGELHAYLKSEMGKKLQLPQLIDLGCQIAEGMVFLESKNYIHRDLATRNILLDENLCAKIADFGLARAIPNDIYMANIESSMVPIKWTAPEALFYLRFSTKSDVWSFGILLTELVTYGDTPYLGLTNDEVRRILEKGNHMDRPQNCPPMLYDIMLACWQKEPENRPTFVSLHSRLEELMTNEADYEDVYSLF